MGPPLPTARGSGRHGTARGAGAEAGGGDGVWAAEAGGGMAGGQSSALTFRRDGPVRPPETLPGPETAGRLNLPVTTNLSNTGHDLSDGTHVLPIWGTSSLR